MFENGDEYVNPTGTHKMTYNNRRSLFYDLDTKSTFSVSSEQWDNAVKEYERRSRVLTAPNARRFYVSPCFSITTETGTHYRWLFREDQDYREDHVRGIK